MEKALFRCGALYPGVGEEVLRDQTIVARDGVIERMAPSSEIPLENDAQSYDFTDKFVIPGLIDVHTHLAYGNAKSEEDIDLYCSLELRAVRATFFAHQVLAAGFTSIVAPGDAGMVTSAVRDGIDAGLFEGPRITTAGPYITSRQGLTDWYPTWIGAPTTSIGRLVKSSDEAIEEIRRQVKDGVDVVKIAMDGLLKRPDGELVAAFNEAETKAMVAEIHRLGKKAIVHARGREATLYSAKAGADLIFHASYMDDEGLDAVLENGSAIAPTFTLLCNTMDFIQPADPWAAKHRDDAYKAEFDVAVESMQRARKAGVPMPIGTDSGFAVTPYGEWHARELGIYVEHLGFSPIEALRAGTSVGAQVVRPADKVGTIAPGYAADLVILDGDPTEDISILLERDQIHMVLRGGVPATAPRQPHALRSVSDFSMTMFSDVYTRERVAELRRQNILQ